MRDDPASPPPALPTGRPVAIDANALDGGGPLVDRFVALVAAGEVSLLVGDSVRDEIGSPATPPAIREWVAAHPAGPMPPLTHAAKLGRIRVRAILRGDAAGGRHESDAAHLSEAAERGCTFFLTHDRRLLRRREMLRPVLPQGLRIVTLERFLAIHDERIAARNAEEDW